MTEPQKYIGKPIEVEALRVSQYGDFVRARDWINGTTTSKTTAHFQQATNQHAVDLLILASPEGVLDVLEDSYIVLVNGEFRAMSAEEFEASYARAFDAPKLDEPIVGTYLPKGKPGKSLLGGAALQIPTA
jgi:hypothetical protein